VKTLFDHRGKKGAFTRNQNATYRMAMVNSWPCVHLASVSSAIRKLASATAIEDVRQDYSR